MPPRRKYHHGNLRAALIEEGLKLISEKGVRALTLREIGTRLGVSRMAAYRHFADKDDMLGAIRQAGFEEFATALDQARQSAQGGFRERLKAMGVAYVRFSVEHPAYFEAMFGWTDSPEKSVQKGKRAFEILVQTVAEGQAEGHVRSGDPVLLARVVWAQVHGISALRLARDIDQPGCDRDFLELSSDILQAGLANRSDSAEAETLTSSTPDRSKRPVS
jgi:AcrR family transcriptional regulator